MSSLPKNFDPNLIVGLETSDDAAVYKIDDERGIVQSLDFFTPNVDDPYLFGQIAATNALSDVYAMGGRMLTAMNITCFPENGDMAVLGEILRGGADKVKESGGILCGGHTVNDKEPKYGLSVTGMVELKKMMRNNSCRVGDVLILTKPLGVSIVLAAERVGEAAAQSVKQAHLQMTTLNKYASEIAMKYDIHAMTDVTGFGFLGHLSEMATEDYTIEINASKVPYIEGAYEYAEELLVTAAGQHNRNHYSGKLYLENVPMAMEELMFDPQTSGGLLFSVSPENGARVLEELNSTLEIPSAMVGRVTQRKHTNIIVRGS